MKRVNIQTKNTTLLFPKMKYNQLLSLKIGRKKNLRINKYSILNGINFVCVSELEMFSLSFISNLNHIYFVSLLKNIMFVYYRNF